MSEIILTGVFKLLGIFLDIVDCVGQRSPNGEEEYRSNKPVEVSHAECVKEIRPEMIKLGKK